MDKEELIKKCKCPTCGETRTRLLNDDKKTYTQYCENWDCPLEAEPFNEVD
jgi:hypothetical protein